MKLIPRKLLRTTVIQWLKEDYNNLLLNLNRLLPELHAEDSYLQKQTDKMFNEAEVAETKRFLAVGLSNEYYNTKDMEHEQANIMVGHYGRLFSLDVELLNTWKNLSFAKKSKDKYLIIYQSKKKQNKNNKNNKKIKNLKLKVKMKINKYEKTK